MKPRERTREDLLAEIAQLRRELAEANVCAEASLQAKTNFLANMSHEIRTPMTSVLGYVDILIEEGTLSLAPPARVAHLYAIKRNGRHMLHILNDILDLSRIEAGKLSIERISVSPFELMDDVMAVIRPSAENRSIRVEVEYEGQIPERIETDPTRLRQILLNLLGNAVKFTEIGGVHVRVQFLDHGPEPSRLQFMVTDTGIGIAPSVAQRLFQPFCQADESSARGFGGAGLGLAISREIARLLGGDIELESSEGWGSTFTLRIATECTAGSGLIEAEEYDPLSKSEELDTLTFIETVEDSATGDRHVLVVEDCDDNARIVTHLLRKAGFQTSRARNGKEAVKLALSASEVAPFDLILMDMQMPVMSGYDATQTLRMQGYDGPILALTAHAMREERQKCLSAGCDEFATKPIDRKDLLNKILSLLEKGSTRAEADLSGWNR